MFKINSILAGLLGVCLISVNTPALNANMNSTTVFLTGSGIAVRLHDPSLSDFTHIDTKFVRISESGQTTTKSDIDLKNWLFLGTPVYKHKDHLIYATKKYKNILCEKPVGLSLSDINQIKQAIEENNVQFIVNYPLRFLPVIKQVKEFISCNDIKSIKVTCNADFNKNPPNKSWKTNFNLGGGVVYSILPHLSDILNFIVDPCDLSSIRFESTSKIPMDDIRVFSKTLSKIDTEININLRENFDELKLEIQTPEESKIIDLIDSNENLISGTKYQNGTLPATSKISPWNISFKYLLQSIFSGSADDTKLAKIQDAEKVHQVIDALNRELSRI